MPSLTWTTMYGALSLNQISRAGNRGEGGRLTLLWTHTSQKKHGQLADPTEVSGQP